MELANREDSSQGNQEKLEPTDAPCLDKRKEDLKAEAEVGTGQEMNQKEPEIASASTLEDKKDGSIDESLRFSQHTNTGTGDGEDHAGKNLKEPVTTSASTLKDKKHQSKDESVRFSQHTNTGAGDGEDHAGKNLKEPVTTSASTLKDKKHQSKDESVRFSQHTNTGTGDGEDHAGKNLKEPVTTSASTLKDKKHQSKDESVRFSQHTNTGTGDGEDHAGKNLKEPVTTSASTLKDKKHQSKDESVRFSQHTNTGTGDEEDSTHENQEELETRDKPCQDMKKDDLKAETDIRAGQREDHTGRNQREPETTPVSTLEDETDESEAENVGSSEHTKIGAGDAETFQDTTRRRKALSQKKDEQKKDIENIGPTTLETTKPTMSQSNSQRGTVLSLIIILALALVVFLSFTFKFHQSDSPLERDDVSIKFSRQMDKVENRFRNQEPEFWRRTRIHLQRHLQMAEPTEPVSLILTAGLRAEKTLDCLARGLASAFASAFNSSFLHIDGASKASQDSDQVKLDIDSKLQGAFEGGKPAAVIHRFEELPPGSTLIFYRYCDHENAAYKETFLIFTVLLEEEEEITANIRLSTLEEMVDDYLKKKFLSDSSPVSYDRMDLDKYGGLWSRISHLILPVAADERIEHAGCHAT